MQIGSFFGFSVIISASDNDCAAESEMCIRDRNSSGEKLIPALRAVVAGQRWIPKEVASRLAARKSFEELTSREVQVLDELAKGLANKEIADILNISEHTVKDHLKNILAKLRVADRTEAVTTAIQRGIIHL